MNDQQRPTESPAAQMGRKAARAWNTFATKDARNGYIALGIIAVALVIIWIVAANSSPSEPKHFAWEPNTTPAPLVSSDPKPSPTPAPKQEPAPPFKYDPEKSASASAAPKMPDDSKSPISGHYSAQYSMKVPWYQLATIDNDAVLEESEAIDVKVNLYKHYIQRIATKTGDSAHSIADTTTRCVQVAHNDGDSITNLGFLYEMNEYFSAKVPKTNYKNAATLFLMLREGSRK